MDIQASYQEWMNQFFQENTAFVVIFIIGCFFCLFGYRLFYITIFVSSFSLFSIAIFFLLSILTNNEHTQVVLIVSFCIGLLCAILSLFLVKLGIFLIGLIAGCSIGFVFSPVFDNPVIPLVFGIVGGLFTLFLEKPMLILATASTGALLIFWAVLQVLHTSKIIDINVEINPTYFYLICGFWWASFTALGSAFQYRILYKNK